MWCGVGERGGERKNVGLRGDERRPFCETLFSLFLAGTVGRASHIDWKG